VTRGRAPVGLGLFPDLLGDLALHLLEHRVGAIAAPLVLLRRHVGHVGDQALGHGAPLRRFPPTFSMQAREQ
jgi:hypothetical protein